MIKIYVYVISLEDNLFTRNACYVHAFLLVTNRVYQQQIDWTLDHTAMYIEKVLSFIY